MELLITGAAGNLGGFFSEHMLGSSHTLRLMIHRKELPGKLANHPAVRVQRGDLAEPSSLQRACEGVDCIVHFAGVLFQPRPARFLQQTNVKYVENLAAAAQAARIRRFILISFPHVEGESSPAKPALGTLTGNPESLHAHTRLAAEKHLFQLEDSGLEVVSLRAGMIYGKGVLMLDAARWLLQRRLLPVWRQTTWIHLLSLPDFLACVRKTVESDLVRGIYNLGDDAPLTLQEFLAKIADHWGFPRPLQMPRSSFYVAAWLVEMFASVFRTTAPITRDFIRIGMASYTADTHRMKSDLRPDLSYPTLESGIHLL